MRCIRRLFPLAAALLTCAPVEAQDTVRGEETFRTVCSACHTVQPPPLKAPPMAHVARHYLAADTARSVVMDRLVAWIREPAKDRSLMPAMAIERWGLMPPLALPESQLRDVAAYVLTLARPAGPGMGRGMMGGGMRMRMHRGGR